MHLRFSEDELATLVEMLSLAANVASWNRKPGSDEGVAAFEALEDKILSKAKLAGFGEAITWDEERQRHVVSREFADDAFFSECYDEFRNENFWEELVIRLADRDLQRSIGKEAWEQLDEDERRRRTSEIEKNYWKEFTDRGIDRVAVIFPPGEGGFRRGDAIVPRVRRGAGLPGMCWCAGRGRPASKRKGAPREGARLCARILPVANQNSAGALVPPAACSPVSSTGL